MEATPEKSEIQKAREYIEYFSKYVFKKPVGFVDTRYNGRIFIATATDEQIIWIAEQLKEMEVEAAQNTTKGALH